ncbi:MAG: T9SS type A sorting domain-containing protein, partial [Candidatus Marinimicrobia bacterium]|nr:T9SS type A sorting domain-containing protein [Candidatus Neomarinimicrobiota bacterium]
ERIDEYIFFLSIYSNQSSGETVKLKVWNASNGRLHPTVTPTFTFTANETNGKPTSPLDFEASTDVVQWLTLKSGANWTSINVTPTDLKANSVFSSNLGAIDSIVTQSGNNIKSSGSFSSSLTLDNTSMVKIYGNTTKEFEIEGLPLTPSSTSISLAQGWNWISFTPNFNLETNEALANYSAKDGDVISSYSDFSIYDSETGWIGTLNIMAPGNGYMLYTSNASPGTLIYPDGGIYLRTPTLKLLSKGYEDIGWEIDNEYKYSMYLIAGVNMNEVSISLNDQLAAFSNGELIGHAMPVAVNDTLLYFMNIYSNEKINSEKISFKVFSKRDGNIKSILQKVSFNNNQILGSINKPLSFSRSSLTKNDNGYVPNEFVLDQNYPNPFNPRTKIGFGVPQSGPVRIMVYNLLGQEVISLWDGNLEPGYKFVTWDGTDQIGNQVSAGIYILLMDSPGFRKSRKMLLIK